MIQYLYKDGIRPCSKEPLKVRLDGKNVGEIRKVKSGFQYFPKGQKTGGDIFQTLEAVQRDLNPPSSDEIEINFAQTFL